MGRDTQPCGLVILPLAVAIRWRAGELTPTDKAVIDKAMRDPLGDSPEESIDSWVSVPAVPTLEMEVAFAEAWFAKRLPIDDIDMADAWRAAIAAAPVAPVEPLPISVDLSLQMVQSVQQQLLEGFNTWYADFTQEWKKEIVETCRQLQFQVFQAGWEASRAAALTTAGEQL